jgi:hypothetical protein
MRNHQLPCFLSITRHVLCLFNDVRWRTATALPADSLFIQLGLPTLRNAKKNKGGTILV